MGLYEAYTGYTDNLIPTMASNSMPSGTASASTEFDSGYAAWKAMDRATSTLWATTVIGVTPCWLEYEFAASKTITKYTITATSNPDGAPNTWEFQGYNGSSWDALDTQSSIVFTASEKKEYTFSNSTAYTRYRIYITANNGRTTTQIAELEAMETEPQVDDAEVAQVSLQTEITQRDAEVVQVSLQVEVKSPPVLRYWDGAAWTAKPLKYWNGAAWVEKPLKYHDGASWI